jgi:hypothetical protein
MHGHTNLKKPDATPEEFTNPSSTNKSTVPL